MKTKTYSIAIFFRRINDLEQYFPIINGLIEKKHNIFLICLNKDFKIEKYKKLNSYKKFKNIKINYFFNFLIKDKIFTKKIYSLAIKFELYRLKYFLDSKIFTKDNIKNFINSNKIKFSIFDFPISNSQYQNFMVIFRNLGVKIFGIHHAIWVRDINLKNRKIRKIFLHNKKNSKYYDKILVFNNEYLKSIKSVNCKNKFLFYGILLCKKVKNTPKKRKEKKINILYLDHSAKHGIDKIKVVNDLNILKKHEEINITIRPNTSVEFIKDNEDLDIFYKNKLNRFISYQDTKKLISKSDIIINPISSAIINGYFLGKIIIHPIHYIPDEEMIWQRYKSCFETKSIEEIKKVVYDYKNNKLNKKKYQKNCNRMLRFLCGNYNNKNKIENIIKEITYEK